jgi:phage-related protein
MAEIVIGETKSNMTVRRHSKSSFHKSSGGFGSSIASFFRNSWNWVKQKANDAWNWVTGVVSTVHQDVRDVVSGVNKDITGVVSGVKDLAVHTQDALTGTVKTVVTDATDLGKSLGSDVASISSSLALPLTLAGGAALLFMMTKK